MMMIIRLTGLLGQMIAGLRAMAGMTQIQLAEISGVANSQISKYERLDVTPDVETMRKLLEACGWRLVMLHALDAETYTEREAVIDAARAAVALGVILPTALVLAVDALTAAEHDEPRPGTRRETPLELIARLRREVEHATTQLAEYEAIFGDLRSAVQQAHARIEAGGDYEIGPGR